MKLRTRLLRFTRKYAHHRGGDFREMQLSEEEKSNEVNISWDLLGSLV